MEDKTYRQILRMKALERWENEGGRITSDVRSENSSTDFESNTYVGAGVQDAGITQIQS